MCSTTDKQPERDKGSQTDQRIDVYNSLHAERLQTTIIVTIKKRVVKSRKGNKRGIPRIWSKCCTCCCSPSPGGCRCGCPLYQVRAAWLLHLLDVLTFINLKLVPAGFALIKQVTLHTFGLVQSKLFPVYFYCLVGSSFVSLAVYAVYHPRELLDWHESVQMILYFVALVTAGLNAQWFGPVINEVLLQKMEVEKEHGLGNQIGFGSQKEGYAKLKEQDPKYRACRSKFGRYHGLSSLCNLIGFLCTTTNLIYTALNLSTI